MAAVPYTIHPDCIHGEVDGDGCVSFYHYTETGWDRIYVSFEDMEKLMEVARAHREKYAAYAAAGYPDGWLER